MSPSRIDELRRRVQNDPASIAFAQLAEEYRRSGQTDEAVRICREGLVRHPGYLSARVTLGRALLDLGQLSEARGEFEFVVAEAPENLAAVRGLAEIFHRDGQTAEALSYYQRALALARHDPEIEEIVQQLSRQIGVAQSGPPGGLSFEEAHQELLSAAERVPLAPQATAPPPVRNAAEGSTAPFDFDRLVAALGSPAAPPQLEAAVAGHAAPAITLPDVVDLGPNPFAALEAELRAHDTAPVTMPDFAPVADESPSAVEALLASPPAAAGELTDVGAAMGAELTSALAPSPGESIAADVVEDAIPAAPELPEFPETASVAADTLSAALADLTALDVVPGMAEAATEPPPASDVPAAAPTSAGEDVLGDLESWLNTLHDKSTE
ncbi:MAG: tetratricopeptide repeat protein [Acidobacteria bacterium]|nr:tetratricopeptide repeat protein [Acidobacteriota bacterium]